MHCKVGLFGLMNVGLKNALPSQKPEARAPRNLADQLTLFKPVQWEQIMPLTLLPAPLESKSYLHLCIRCMGYKFSCCGSLWSSE